MKSLLNVGIDVGSTTIKLVVLDHKKNILYKTTRAISRKSAVPCRRI